MFINEKPAPSSPLHTVKTTEGYSLFELSQNQKIYVVFVRHFGCTFCREVLADLAEIQQSIAAGTMQLVIVHMSDEAYGEKMLEKYGLHTAIQISDPNRRLYKYFGLQRGSFKQLFGMRMWIRGFYAGVLKGHWVGRLRGDGFQMPGYFIIDRGRIIEQYIPQDAADHPDHLALTQCALDRTDY